MKVSLATHKKSPCLPITMWLASRGAYYNAFDNKTPARSAIMSPLRTRGKVAGRGAKRINGTQLVHFSVF